MTTTSIFAFTYQHFPWDPLAEDEYAPGNKTLWEIRCIPGNLIGCGRTRAEAEKSVIGLLHWTFKDESSFEAWYQEAWTYAHDGDGDIFGRIMTDLARGHNQPRETWDSSVRYVRPSLVPS